MILRNDDKLSSGRLEFRIQCRTKRTYFFGERAEESCGRLSHRCKRAQSPSIFRNSHMQ